ncbi:MAG: hypothetical protein JOY56_10955, partial [Solirubrobacterales bacterium]|nr:hypothetical protein [Solirubrobacterales bacterium]MBV9334514.1 hypothetical protein [Solirubrobacterales bacterium]MBV9944324.1 hypothetical protein [Solirubrobacterales bacterium]
MAVFVVLLAALSALVATRRRRRGTPAQAVIISSPKSTVVARDGAVRSVQLAELTLAEADFRRLWNAANLENLARTYWRFLSRVTLGFIRVVYGEDERSVVLLARPLTLLRFDAPNYSLEHDYGSVRWRIRDGLLVARAGRGCGFLALVVTHLASEADGRERVLIEVEVANFYPAIAAGFSVPAYEVTQSAIHVLVTHAFLRSLARLDLAKSKVGRFAARRPDVRAAGRAAVARARSTRGRVAG